MNRVVVVTGAGRGIGRAHALTFAAEGARVVVNDLGVDMDGGNTSSGPADKVVEEIRQNGGIAVASSADIATWEGARALIEQTIDSFGALDTLVCNAGNLRDRMLVNMSEADWDSVINTHLKGHFCPLRHAASYWRAESKAGNERAGRVVLTSSGAGLFGNVGQTNYVAAKAAIAALARTAAAELAHYGVAVNAIGPLARSRMTGPRESAASTTGFDTLDPMNISPLVVWLGSAHCTGVSGEVFEVSGGSIGVFEPWARGPSIDKQRRWEPSEVGDSVGLLLDARRGFPVAGTPAYGLLQG